MNHEVFESWLRYLNSQLRRGMAGQNLYQEHSPQTMEKRPTLAPKQQLQAVMSESKMIFLNLTFTISQTTATAGIMQLNLVPQIKSTINATCLNHPKTSLQPQSVEKTVFCETAPSCQKAWGLLL